MNLPKLLLTKGLLTPADHKAVEADLANKASLEDALSAHGINPADALSVAGEAYGLPARSLGDPPADEKAFPYVPLDSARHYGFVPLKVEGGALEIGLTDPDNLEALDALQFISSRVGMPYKLYLISRRDFERVLEAYQNLSGEGGKAPSECESAGEAAGAPTGLRGGAPAVDLSHKEAVLKEDAPVTKVVSTILR